MVFFRRWLLILLALWLGGGPLVAAPREDRAYQAAVATFHDQNYTTATNRLAQFLQTYRKSTNAPSAILLLAQAEFYLKSYSSLTNRLGDPVNLARARTAGLADAYDYWRGEAQYAQGDFDGAAQTFVSVAANYPDSPLALKAVVEAAAAYGQNSNWARVDDLLDSTNGVFQRRARLDPANEQVSNGRLLQARSKCAQRDFDGAIRVLDSLAPAPLKPEQDWKRAHLLYSANFGRRDLEAALGAATNLFQIARLGRSGAWGANLAESVACRAEVFEEQGRLAEASEAWRENLTNNIPVEEQRRAILKVAELEAAQAKLAEAEADLTTFLTSFPDSPAAGVARLRLGELELEVFIDQPLATNQLAEARTNLDQIINAEPHGALAGKAYLDHGWCNWIEAENAWSLGDTNAAWEKFGESFGDFSKAAGILPRGSEDLAVATFKMGDAQFATNNYAGAMGSYQAVLTDFPGMTNVANSLGERALYQILRAQLELRDTNGMDQTMGQLLDHFFASPTADSGLLMAGQGFSDFGYPANARALFQRFAAERTNSPLMPQVAFGLARTFEQEQNWPATVTNCEAWLQAYPAEKLMPGAEYLRPQVEYVRAWAVSQTGDEAGAFHLFTNFVSHYPTNTLLTPLARWAVADYYFRLGTTNFFEAEKQYEYIFQDFPGNELAGQAQLMAARAAMGRSSYPQAASYLTALIGDSNSPGDLRDKARFAYCEAMRQMATFETNNASLQRATNILTQMYSETPTNIAGALAWCETGDFDRQLVSLDEATNAYAMVLAAPSASLPLRCRAQVGWGIALEKKAEWLTPEAQRPLRLLALEKYHDVIYTTNDTTDQFWMKEAAFRTLPLMPLVQEGSVDEFINRLEHWLPQLTDKLEEKRALLKK